jgi:acetone carboxylase gamma subunit
MDRNHDVTVRNLVLGDFDDEEVRDLIRAKDTDPGRFQKYNAILQEIVPWEEAILLRISEHLFVVRKADGGRVVKCDCGQEFGDYRRNWKLGCAVFVRDSRESMGEVFTADIMPHPDNFEVREFYCPSCAAQLGVEVAPPGYPLTLELLPDIDTLYGEWLGEPLPDSSVSWYQDLTWETTRKWIEDA